MRKIALAAALFSAGFFAACEQPTDDEAAKPADQPAAEAPAEGPGDMTGEEAMDGDAPSEPSTGEPPSPSQPQPVYPDGAPQ